MIIDRLSEVLEKSGVIDPVIAKLDVGEDATLGVPLSARPLIVATAFRHDPRPTLVVVSGEEAADRFARGVSVYLGRERVLLLPCRKDVPWGVLRPDPAQVGARARAIHALTEGESIVVVTPARALLRCIPPKGSGVFSPLIFTKGEQLDPSLSYETLADQLSKRGYLRLENAEEAGTFSVHGDTLDVFPADSTYPVRLEFFGDEIDGMRRVVPSTGQSIGELEQVEVYPCRELAPTRTGARRARQELEKRSPTHPELAYHLDLLDQGIHFNELERYLPYLYRKVDTPVAYASKDTLVTLIEPRSLFDDTTRYYDELKASADAAKVELDGLFVKPNELDFGFQQRFTLLSLMRTGSVVDVDLEVKRPDGGGSEERLLAQARSLVASGNITVLAIPDRHAREATKLALTDVSIPLVDMSMQTDEAAFTTGVVNVIDSDIPSGLIIPKARLGILTLGDSSARAATRVGRATVDPTSMTFPYKPGDYVVHATHGIALFKKIVRQEVAGVERDYLLLEYAKEDKLYAPVEQIDRITRYVGPEGTAPRLTRLNTSDWTRATGRARKAAKQLAFDLVDLYARRASVIGFSYEPDNEWQREMEALFPYEETPDQRAAIADVKADMESPKPMDRLICGDVGFGKTEVALRAAFKAVQSNRQVMLLCPTTILAQQHYTTFEERFAPFGVKVEVLSRFRTDAQQRAALEGFAAGTTDVVVGTHRLLSRDVNPKDLGLIIIDEEQRFGVQHKEQLKNLREQVDVLTLSATPIPRTLQMSLSGVRDMSLIDTPPASRTPIKVHVGEWDEDVVSAAVRYEVGRGGQVYYVSNRVKSIDDAVARVRAVAPESRIGVAHGQMSERELEHIMESFAANEIDVLVATTIIESGLDNPHSNTLIIEDSQRLGLAQLYQLKGRVGRAHAQAYAYFLFPSSVSLTQQAIDRLTAIGEYQGLGSGMKIAMRDLEIRGAGSLLGAEQHGTLSAVGFDLFASMLSEAVSAARGEDRIAHFEVKIDLPLHFYLPEEYIPAADERVLFYRRLAAAETVQDVHRVEEQLEKTYGALPVSAQNMVDRALARAYAAGLGIVSITLIRNKLSIEPVELTLEEKERISKRGGLYMSTSKKLLYPPPEGEGILACLIGLLENLSAARIEKRIT